MKNEQEKRFEIIDFAIDHGLVINPSKGMEVYVDNILKFGYCPCDSTRPDCPCSLAEEEITKNGHCRCGLYWSDYRAFKKTLRPLKGK